MLHDLRHAIRVLLHTKGWTTVVLLSLALGIGANTALFTAVNGLLLQTVSVPDPESLVKLSSARDNNMRRSSSNYGYSPPYQGRDVRATFSYAVYEQLRSANQTLTDLVASAPIGSFNVVVDGSAEIATAVIVSGNYFRVLRVPAAIGRVIEETDDRPGAAPVAILSHAYWRRRFASDPQVIGSTVRINNVPVTIIGVTGAGFTSLQRLGAVPADVTVPLALDPQLNLANARLQVPTSWWLQVMGRLKPGATYEQVAGNLEGPFREAARAGMASYMSGLTAEQSKLSQNRSRGDAVPQLLVRSGARGVYALDTNSSRSATILSVIVGLLLLIVCANVANLLLSRAASRYKEISVRLSMGASRTRLVRQLLTESLLLSGIGGALGILVGYWSKKLLPFGQNAEMDWRVLAFVASVSVLTGVVFGLVPALRATSVDLAGAMKDNSRSLTGSRTLLSKGLLVMQVAVSLVLLIGAGLFLRTLQNLRAVDVGFNPSNILMFRVNPQLNRYEPERISQLYRELQTSLETLPGAHSVGLSQTALLSGSETTAGMFIQGNTVNHGVYAMSVSPGFFKTMEIPVLLGRDFNEHDVANPTASAVINETAARKYFPNESPLGRRIGPSLEESGQSEIVGVIRDTKYNSIRDEVPPTMYTSIRGNAGSVWVLMRTEGDPSGLIAAVRNAVQQIDPEVPLAGMTTQTEQLEGRFAQERLFAMAYSLFGGLALLLACIGLFGVMSYSVSRRTNEIGIRMALGAQRGGVIGMVLRESMIMVAIGVVLGLAGAIAAGRLIASVLYGLTATDVWSMAAAVALMTAVSFAAGYLPARRASRVDPMTALRYE
ncbi:MAG: ABC transporter permease [Acidobacteriota bacterium]|nr:ABC transporter permease [Acidobacteriota bacterium]